MKTAMATANTPSAIHRKRFRCPGRTSGSSGGSPAGDRLLGRLDVALDLGAQRVDDAHQLELAAADAVLALEPEQQALVVDAQHVGAAAGRAGSAAGA